MKQADIKKSLLEELGLSGIPKEKQEQLVVKMTEVLLKRIFLETVNKLDEKNREEYAKMIENNPTPEELDEFLSSRINNYDEMINTIIENFKEEMKKKTENVN
ncbi:MAG: hypothetical protein CO140_01560 [Candidatus Moranbacteria bacterium CG_4_9_14_3_um_filter_40_7]|nr:MAG: hypothetical protein CO140_01560 [Candidatus Moranbacteria bacterium CG_4_9_14_3_um_filter_40_7]